MHLHTHIPIRLQKKVDHSIFWLQPSESGTDLHVFFAGMKYALARSRKIPTDLPVPVRAECEESNAEVIPFMDLFRVGGFRNAVVLFFPVFFCFVDISYLHLFPAGDT